MCCIKNESRCVATAYIISLIIYSVLSGGEKLFVCFVWDVCQMSKFKKFRL